MLIFLNLLYKKTTNINKNIADIKYTIGLIGPPSFPKDDLTVKETINIINKIHIKYS